MILLYMGMRFASGFLRGGRAWKGEGSVRVTWRASRALELGRPTTYLALNSSNWDSRDVEDMVAAAEALRRKIFGRRRVATDGTAASDIPTCTPLRAARAGRTERTERAERTERTERTELTGAVSMVLLSQKKRENVSERPWQPHVGCSSPRVVGALWTYFWRPYGRIWSACAPRWRREATSNCGASRRAATSKAPDRVR